jgi:TonB family protein
MSGWIKGLLVTVGILTGLLAITAFFMDQDDAIVLWVVGLTAIVLLVIVLYAIRFWKIVALTVVIGAGAAWGWLSYQNRPYPVEELVGIRLGMSPVAVTLALGDPDTQTASTVEEDLEFCEDGLKQQECWRQVYYYNQIQVHFLGVDTSALKATLVCTTRRGVSLFGLGRNYLWLGASSESDVIERLGEPDSESIHQSGTRKILSHEEWQTAFTFEKNKVIEVCAARTGSRFEDEYGDVASQADPDCVQPADGRGCVEDSGDGTGSGAENPRPVQTLSLFEELRPIAESSRAANPSPGNGIVNPVLLRNVPPEYTRHALRARIEGTVHLKIVVLPDGTVGDVTVVKSLDTVYGLDQEAIKAVRRWRFRPATRSGEPVAFLATAELSFTIG